MARGGASPAPTPLPKVSFEKVQDDEISRQPRGVHDQQMRSYGYNDFSDFKRPEHYMRYIEPLESELSIQVEYDMDEQDLEWLEVVNAERKAQQMDKISYELFEIVMDRLEKEWFDLTKNIPKPDMALPSEDSTCAICDDSEGENTNAIVFCDGCNLAVHQDCYGVPYIPEGQWLCRKCTVSPENPVSCTLCPNEGGAFKQTAHGDWVHLLCAIWVPETRVANDVFMEPITGIDKISKQRWKLKCSICGIREGACIQCTKASCFLAFHATCARKEKLLMPMKSSQGSEAPALACYCEKHLPREQAEARAAALAAEQLDGYGSEERPPSPKSSKTARAYAKTYKPGPPLVPQIIVERILQYIAKVNVRQKREFLLLVCKYWSLKREARRGAAFLKRLHLEPWTASAATKQQTDQEKMIKLEFMKRLRHDLESVRFLAELSRKRESRKRDQVEAIQDVFSHILFAHEPPLRMTFERIIAFDRNEYFKNPVNKADVPDYFDIIKHPMCWNMIEQKLELHEYLDLREFQDDVNLVLNNAIVYNKPGTTFYKAAQRIKASVQPLLAELHNLVSVPSTQPEGDRAPIGGITLDDAKIEPEGTTAGSDKVANADGPSGELAESTEGGPEDIESTNGEPTIPPKPPVGDLEPPLELLELLISEDTIKDETDLIIGKEPLESLFSYEFAEIRPPPPPPPPKPKRDRKADMERKRQEREAERAAAALDGGPGFRATRRRSAAAAVAGSEASTSAATVEEPEQEVASGSRQRKKRPIAAPQTSAEPAVVEDVNNQQSFKLFEQGWILPSSQRRGGRAPIERQPLPPPKKKQKIDRGKSQLSTFSTSVAENETLAATPPPPDSAMDEPSASASGPLAVSMDVDHPEVPQQPQQEVPSVVPSEQVADSSGPSDASEAPAQQLLSYGAEEDGLPVPPAVMPSEPVPSEPRPSEPAPSEAIPSEFAPSEPILSEPEPSEPIPSEPEPSEPIPSEPAPSEPAPSESAPSEPAPSEPAFEPASAPAAPTPDPAPSDEPQGADSSSEPLAPPDVLAEPPDAAHPAAAAEVAPQPAEPEPPVQQRARRQKRQAAPLVVIEKLDTPQIRHERYLKRKAEKAAAQAAAAAASGPSRDTHAESDMESELTSLSQLSDSEDEGGAGESSRRGSRSAQDRSAKAAQRPRGRKSPEPGEIVLEGDERVEGGTLVWAKASSFPWWPAVIFEEDDEGIPRSVLNQKAVALKKTAGPLYLIRFYDSGNTWQWLGIKCLRMLGEDDKLDADMLATASVRQKWKNTRLREECRQAFRRAMAERETDDTGEVAAEPGQGEAPAASNPPADVAMVVDGEQDDAISPMTELEG